MRIRLDLPNIYENLARPRTIDPKDEFYLEAVKQMREGEEWRDERRISVPAEDISIVNLGIIILPTPFSEASGHFERRGKRYIGRINLAFPPEYYTNTQRENEIVRVKIQEGLGKNFQGDWMQMNSNSGYLLTGGKPKVAVHEKGRHTIVDVGSFGTKEARFSDYEGFSNDGLLLERVINVCVNSGIEFAVSKGILPSNPDIESRLEPIKSS